MTIKEHDLRPTDSSDPPRPAPPDDSFPWAAVIVAAVLGALLGSLITALVLLGRSPNEESTAAIIAGHHLAVLLAPAASLDSALEVIR